MEKANILISVKCLLTASNLLKDNLSETSTMLLQLANTLLSNISTNCIDDNNIDYVSALSCNMQDALDISKNNISMNDNISLTNDIDNLKTNLLELHHKTNALNVLHEMLSSNLDVLLTNTTLLHHVVDGITLDLFKLKHIVISTINDLSNVADCSIQNNSFYKNYVMFLSQLSAIGKNT